MILKMNLCKKIKKLNSLNYCVYGLNKKLM